jgi:hypothetical protein
LHTNDAASAITRLLDMGVEDYLLTSTLSVTVSRPPPPSVFTVATRLRPS